MTVSFWRDRSWSADHHADVVVVGAGWHGAACAWWLARQGLGVTLMRTGAAGGGVAEQGPGLLRGPAEPYALWVDRLGRERAQQRSRRWREARQALLEEVVEDRGTQCGLVGGGVVQGARSAIEAEELERSAALLSDDGVLATWLDREAVTEALGSEGLVGGLLDPDGGAAHPAQLLELLLLRAQELGVHLRASGPAFAVEDSGDGVTVRAEQGSVHAEQAVLCEGGRGDLVRAVLAEGLRARQAQLLATAPVPERVAPWALVADGGDLSAQQLPGGEVVAACWRDRMGQGPREAVSAVVGGLADVAVTHQWRWRVAEPADGLPLVAPLSGQARVKLVVGCVDGGLVWGFAAAQALARWVVDGEPPTPFDIGRLNLISG